MKGIILAGGRGTRLHPLTLAVSKGLLPVYDKPMIYYPLSVLMLAGIRRIMVISTPTQLPIYKRLLGEGERWGLQFKYAEQEKPRGLPDAFQIARDFLMKETVCLALGDNILFGHGLPERLRSASSLTTGAFVFAYPVKDPTSYGVVELDRSGKIKSIEEKPESPRSRLAIPGLYFFDEKIVEISEELKPSDRGELEIIDVLRGYHHRRELQVEVLGRGIAWLDAGSAEALMQASSFVQAVQERQGLMISSPEEIAFRMGYIDRDQLRKLTQPMGRNEYRRYLLSIVESDPFPSLN